MKRQNPITSSYKYKVLIVSNAFNIIIFKENIPEHNKYYISEHLSHFTKSNTYLRPHLRSVITLEYQIRFRTSDSNMQGKCVNSPATEVQIFQFPPTFILITLNENCDIKKSRFRPHRRLKIIERKTTLMRKNRTFDFAVYN